MDVQRTELFGTTTDGFVLDKDSKECDKGMELRLGEQ